MKDFTKKYIKTIRLNSFRPLCMTEIGLRAINDYDFPPFIDASCRREPDLENDFPSITALCRQEKFAPILYPNDIIVYITVKGKWLTDYDHYRLIAILVVTDKKQSHLEAANWYRSKKTKVPSNCMIEENLPYEFHETAGNYERKADIQKFLSSDNKKQKLIGKRRIELWNGEYLKKSKKWGVFVITKPIFIELNNPPILTDDDMKKIFGKVPNTRNPNKIKKEELKELAKYADIDFKYE